MVRVTLLLLELMITAKNQNYISTFTLILMLFALNMFSFWYRTNGRRCQQVHSVNKMGPETTLESKRKNLKDKQNQPKSIIELHVWTWRSCIKHCLSWLNLMLDWAWRQSVSLLVGQEIWKLFKIFLQHFETGMSKGMRGSLLCVVKTCFVISNIIAVSWTLK